MGMSTGGGGGRAPLSEINVTPLVDVMLVLLIIFMVSAPLLTTGIEVDLPNAEAPGMEIDEDLPLVVVERIPDEERQSPEDIARIYYFDELVTLGALEQRLETDERLVDPESGLKRVFVQADEAVPYGAVVQVLALVRQAGVQQMGLVTDPLARASAPIPGSP